MNTLLITEHDAAQMLSITDREVSRLVKSKLIPTVRLPIGNVVRFAAADLERWVAEHKQEPAEA